MFRNKVNFMGRGFYGAEKLRADESKGTQEGRVMATKKLKKSFFAAQEVNRLVIP